MSNGFLYHPVASDFNRPNSFKYAINMVKWSPAKKINKVGKGRYFMCSKYLVIWYHQLVISN